MKTAFDTREITSQNAKKVIEQVGFDKSYINKALSKYQFKLIKIYKLTPQQATIVKQLALSVGADAAVHREVITCKIEFSDVLLGCTFSQLKLICEKLKRQPFKLPELAKELLKQIKPDSLKIRNKEFIWGSKTYLAGILNVTPDSFSDGGLYFSVEKAVSHALDMIKDGADMIDIGGESTRPGAKAVSVEEEIKRIVPVVEKIREVDEEVVLSIDTRNAKTAESVINAGADIINDVSGLEFDKNMSEVIANSDIPVIVMHSKGTPDVMQQNINYQDNIIDEIYKNLSEKIQKAVQAGIQFENIIIDPGIGFGKTIEHNFEIIKRIKEFKSLGCPLFVGASRKSFIWKTLECDSIDTEEANIAVSSYLAANGADILRVHDVEAHAKAIKILDKVLK